MSNWLARVLAMLIALAAGAMLGFIVGRAGSAPAFGTVLGTAIAAAGAVAFDSLRGSALMEWLRAPQRAAAPREAGFWGEVGYRIERMRATHESQLATERQRLEQFLSAIEASPNGVMMLDADDRIVWCNSVAADHFGLDPQRDRQQYLTNLVRSPAFVAHMQAAQFEQPVIVPGPLGRLTLSVLVRPYGEGMKLVLSQDITQRERTEAMRRDFVANVSHEIRTPLTVLAGFVETLATLPLTEVEHQRVLVLMGQQTDRIQALVGDLLALAEIEGSPRPAADRWVSVGPLLRRVEADARALSAGRHQIEGVEDPNAEIAGNETELISAVGNVLNNAVRYTPEGGRIQVRWVVRGDGGAEIEVADTGIGIAREHIPRLTERFYRVDGSRSRETGGTGLGLSIVKHVVQRHGGEIEVQSEPGKGSRFKLGFPASRVRQRASAALPSTAH